MVTYDTGGCREEIDESCGVLVNKYDKEGLIAGITSLGTKDEAKVNACVQKAGGFEKKAMYDRYNDLFASLLDL